SSFSWRFNQDGIQASSVSEQSGTQLLLANQPSSDHRLPALQMEPSWSGDLLKRLMSQRYEDPALRIHPLLSGQPALQWANQLAKAFSRRYRKEGDLATSRGFREISHILQWIEHPLTSRAEKSMVHATFDWYGDFLERRIHQEGMPAGGEKTALQQLQKLLLAIDEVQKTRVPYGEEMSQAIVEERFRERLA
ncbi:MAG: hypothetical protein ACPGYX_11430, partial [Oceanobacter sp.]